MKWHIECLKQTILQLVVRTIDVSEHKSLFLQMRLMRDPTDLIVDVQLRKLRRTFVLYGICSIRLVCMVWAVPGNLAIILHIYQSSVSQSAVSSCVLCLFLVNYVAQ